MEQGQEEKPAARQELPRSHVLHLLFPQLGGQTHMQVLPRRFKIGLRVIPGQWPPAGAPPEVIQAYDGTNPPGT
eukprot:2041864-Amphidinium_carterae.1